MRCICSVCGESFDDKEIVFSHQPNGTSAIPLLYCEKCYAEELK